MDSTTYLTLGHMRILIKDRYWIQTFQLQVCGPVVPVCFLYIFICVASKAITYTQQCGCIYSVPQQMPNYPRFGCIGCNDDSKSICGLTLRPLPRDVAGDNLGTINHWIRTMTDRMVSMIWPNWHFTKLATGSGLKSSTQAQRLSFKMGSGTAFSSSFSKKQVSTNWRLYKMINLSSVLMAIKYPSWGYWVIDFWRKWRFQIRWIL